MQTYEGDVESVSPQLHQLGRQRRGTLQFPSFPLLLFGNLFHVFIVYVVLTHKTIYPAV